jgi:hypothetical protein
MTHEIQNHDATAVDDLQGLEIDTFKVEELDQLEVDATLSISLCSSTTSSSCG